MRGYWRGKNRLVLIVLALTKMPNKLVIYNC